MGNVVGWGEVLLVPVTAWLLLLNGRRAVWRLTCLAMLACIAEGPLVYMLSGLSLNVPVDHRLQGAAALLAQLLLIPLLWFAGVQLVGKVAGRVLSLVLLLVLVAPTPYGGLADLVWMVLMGSYRASGSLGHGYTYQLDAQKALIGAADYTSYTIYKPVFWFPVVKERVASGAMGTWQGGPVTMRRSAQGKLEVYEVPCE